MVKVVRILWFESISPIDQPFIDTPMGPITLRQCILSGIGAMLGYVLYNALPHVLDQIARLSLASVVFMLAVMIATKRVKTIPPEKHLYFLIFGAGRKRVGGKSRGKEKEGKKREKIEREEGPPGASELPVGPSRSGEVPEEVKRVLKCFTTPLRMHMAAPDSTGKVEIIGRLINPKTGAPMLNTAFYAAVGGAVFSGQSDEKGFYRVRMYPQSPGSYYMIVAVQGFDSPVDSVLINVG